MAELLKQSFEDFECIVVDFDRVELDVFEIDAIVFEIEQGRCVRCAINRPPRLNLQCGGKHIVAVGRYVEQKRAFDALVCSIHQIRPTIVVHKVVQCRLQRFEHLFVGALYLRRIDRYGAFQFLRRNADACEQAYQQYDDIFFHFATIFSICRTISAATSVLDFNG